VRGLEHTGVVALPLFLGCKMEVGPQVDSAQLVLLPQGVEQKEQKVEVGWMMRWRLG